jgi:hypothetical protein
MVECGIHGLYRSTVVVNVVRLVMSSGALCDAFAGSPQNRYVYRSVGCWG